MGRKVLAKVDQVLAAFSGSQDAEDAASHDPPRPPWPRLSHGSSAGEVRHFGGREGSQTVRPTGRQASGARGQLEIRR
jgi:hypothetical protein